MSTHDVPGANPDNDDELAMGCWAEHDDGSKIFVESTEGNRVVYSMFDMAKSPPVEYRDAMAQATFEKTFGKPGDDDGIVWTWHDKTPFDWDAVIRAGARDGTRDAFAEHTLTAAERVAESRHRRSLRTDDDDDGDRPTAAERVANSLRLRGERISRDMGHRAETVVRRSGGIWDKISRAVAELGK